MLKTIDVLTFIQSLDSSSPLRSKELISFLYVFRIERIDLIDVNSTKKRRESDYNLSFETYIYFPC